MTDIILWKIKNKDATYVIVQNIAVECKFKNVVTFVWLFIRNYFSIKKKVLSCFLFLFSILWKENLVCIFFMFCIVIFKRGIFYKFYTSNVFATLKNYLMVIKLLYGSGERGDTTEPWWKVDQINQRILIGWCCLQYHSEWSTLTTKKLR